MNKFLALMLLAAVPLVGKDHHDQHPLDYGFFYVQTAQTILGPTITPSFSGVVWNVNQEVHSRDVFINPNATDEIIIAEPGVYEATFTTFGTPSVGTNFRFALFLNNTIIPGSVYAANAPVGDVTQEIVGHVIFTVTTPNSVLELVNDSAVGTDVTLNNIAGETGAADNTTASLLIEQLRDNAHRH